MRPGRSFLEPDVIPDVHRDDRHVMVLVHDDVEAVGERALGEGKIDGDGHGRSRRLRYRTGMSGILPLFASAVLCAAIETCAAVRSATVRNARAAG